MDSSLVNDYSCTYTGELLSEKGFFDTYDKSTSDDYHIKLNMIMKCSNNFICKFYFMG